jgi:hypothetical protein
MMINRKIIIAVAVFRKEKGKSNWYIGAITDETERNAVIPLSFLDKDWEYKARIYSDAPGIGFNTNPEAYIIKERLLNSRGTLHIRLAAGGGCAVSIVPVKPAHR